MIIDEAAHEAISRQARWMWSVPNRLVVIEVDEDLGLVAVSTSGRSPSAGRVVLLDLQEGSTVASIAVPGSPTSIAFVDNRLVVAGNKRVHVFELDGGLAESHRFINTGSHRSLAKVGQALVLGVGYHDAIFFDVENLASTKRRPGRWLSLLHAPFGPVVLADDGRLLRPEPDHSFSEFGHVGGRPALSWIDTHGRLWISRDRPDDCNGGAGERLDVFTVTGKGIVLDWSDEMDSDAAFLRRNDGVWLIDRTGRIVRPTADGDVEVTDEPLLNHALTSEAHPNFNVISYTTGVLSPNSDNDNFVARLA